MKKCDLRQSSIYMDFSRIFPHLQQFKFDVSNLDIESFNQAFFKIILSDNYENYTGEKKICIIEAQIRGK